MLSRFPLRSCAENIKEEIMNELIEVMQALNRGGMQPKRAYSAFVKCYGTQTIMPGVSEETWKVAVELAVVGGYNLYGEHLDNFRKEIAA